MDEGRAGFLREITAAGSTSIAAHVAVDGVLQVVEVHADFE